MDIAAGIAAATQALSLAKAIAETPGIVEKAELKLQIAELYTVLSDTKLSLVDAGTEISKRGAEIKRLNELLDYKANLLRSGSAYFETDDGGKATGDPFCQHCWETKHQLVHIHRSPSSGRTYTCPSCITDFRSADVKLPEMPGHNLPKSTLQLLTFMKENDIAEFSENNLRGFIPIGEIELAAAFGELLDGGIVEMTSADQDGAIYSLTTQGLALIRKLSPT